VADHQVAHIYVNDRSRINEVRAIVESTPGVDTVLDEEGKQARHIDHARSGEMVAIAAPDAWFTYYYWLDDRRAPDFARTVDIHRKPGYDPAELYLDPAIRYPKAKIAWALTRRKLGQRALIEVIPLDATLVRGSHGRPPQSPEHGPIFATSDVPLLAGKDLSPTDVYRSILSHLTA
jgi:predicted AlkP superfamily pyrophosphatase or phosphodiesterase